MNNRNIKWIAIIALAVGLGGASFVLLAEPAAGPSATLSPAASPTPAPVSPSPAAVPSTAPFLQVSPSTQPKITWSPTSVKVILSPGESTAKNFTFTSDQNLTNAVLEPVPAIARFLSIQPNSFASVSANTPQAVAVGFNISSTATLGTYDGTIHVRIGNQTLPQTLKVLINVVVVNVLPTCTLTANPQTITQGQQSTLKWITTGAPTSAVITAVPPPDVGSVNPAGGSTGVSVKPTATTTYTLTVTNAAGPGTCQATVKVNQAVGQAVWIQRTPATSPPARRHHSMTYDAKRGQVVLFGGLDNNFAMLADTWIWDGINWMQVFPATSPTPRAFHAMAYDAARGQVVMSGGTSANVINLADSWIWDGSTWSQGPLLTQPRCGHAMAFDSARSEVVLFGGAEGPCWGGAPALGDTLVWNGIAWNQKSPAVSPAPRYLHLMDYDAARDQVMLFGGVGYGIQVSETWVWDGSMWSQQLPANNPDAVAYGAMSYHESTRTFLLFGGKPEAASTDIWIWLWDGINWTQRFLTVGPSVSTYGPAMTNDTTRGEVVLFGGRTMVALPGGGEGPVLSNATWVWRIP